MPVISYGTDDFPAFFSPSSGLPSPLRLDTPSEVAKAAKVRSEEDGRVGCTASMVKKKWVRFDVNDLDGSL